jgi:hypothetical protein
MTAVACALAALLTFEAATAPAVNDECELADHRCKAVLFEGRAANAANAEHRAVYLFSAHRLYMRLFDKSGDRRDLCAARRALDASLAVEGQPPSLRAKSETARTEVLARQNQQDAHCGSVSKRRRPKPADAPLVARGSQSPGTPSPDPDPAPPLLGGSAMNSSEAPSEPGSAVTPKPPPPSTGRTNTLDLLAEAALPTTPPAEVSLLPVAARRVDMPRASAPRPGRGLVIAGGVTLGVGVALTAATGYMGSRLSQKRQEVFALDDMLDGYPTADQAAMGKALTREHDALRSQTVALAMASGATLVVAVVLATVGGRRMARAASRTALVPAPGGLVFHARF